jgi:glutamine synthetase
MAARPNPETFQVFPWLSGKHAAASMFCDIINKDGSYYDGDPREELRKVVARAQKKGFTPFLGPEPEFYYFKDDKSTEILEKGTYFDMVPMELLSNLRQETALTLQEMGIAIEYGHHEVGPSQHEIDLRYDEALKMADNVMTYRLVVKESALHRGAYATFMPKPMFGQPGSGMHTHQSLFKNGKNAFYDAKGQYELSETGRSYIAGLLKHAREICLVTNQWVNSYKRLVSGFEAPVYVCWGQNNRSALVRVPAFATDKAARVELRSPDPACNPYLAFAVMIAAGLKGIEEGYDLPDAVDDNIYEMNESQRAEMGIRTLPEDLREAIQATEDSQLVRETLGESVFEWLIKTKKLEWDNYKNRVSSFEVEQFLPTL